MASGTGGCEVQQREEPTARGHSRRHCGALRATLSRSASVLKRALRRPPTAPKKQWPEG